MYSDKVRAVIEAARPPDIQIGRDWLETFAAKYGFELTETGITAYGEKPKLFTPTHRATGGKPTWHTILLPVQQVWRLDWNSGRCRWKPVLVYQGEEGETGVHTDWEARNPAVFIEQEWKKPGWVEVEFSEPLYEPSIPAGVYWQGETGYGNLSNTTCFLSDADAVLEEYIQQERLRILEARLAAEREQS